MIITPPESAQVDLTIENVITMAGYVAWPLQLACEWFAGNPLPMGMLNLLRYDETLTIPDDFQFDCSDKAKPPFQSARSYYGKALSFIKAGRLTATKQSINGVNVYWVAPRDVCQWAWDNASSPRDNLPSVFNERKVQQKLRFGQYDPQRIAMYQNIYQRDKQTKVKINFPPMANQVQPDQYQMVIQPVLIYKEHLPKSKQSTPTDEPLPNIDKYDREILKVLSSRKGFVCSADIEASLPKDLPLTQKTINKHLRELEQMNPPLVNRKNRKGAQISVEGMSLISKK